MGDLDEELAAYPIEFVGDFRDLEGVAALDALAQGQFHGQTLSAVLENYALGEGDAAVLGAHQVDDIRRCRDALENKTSLSVCPGSAESGRSV